MNQASSDEEDVFSCGRCKEQFSSMGGFMEHKKLQVCRKVKQLSMESQQQKQPPSSEILISLSGQEEQDNTPGFMLKATPADSGLSQPSESIDTEYSLQSSVARFQDVLATLQGGQASQLDLPSGGSDSQDSQALIHAFEKILGTTSRNMSFYTIRQGTVYASSLNGGTTENLTTQQAPSPNPGSIQRVEKPGDPIASQPESEPLPENEQLRDAGSGQARAGLQQKSALGESITKAVDIVCSIKELPSQEQASREQALKLDDQPSSAVQKPTTATRIKASKTGHQESMTDSGCCSEIPESFVQNSHSVVCKFCSETMKNADSLFGHYMEVHKMKSGAALEFLRQSAFKRKRGRPPKGLTFPTSKPIFCPHCSVSFNSKTLCAAHIRKHHRGAAVPSASTAQGLPSGRRRKCSRCSFQTTTAKDLTAHIHSCHSYRAESGDKPSEITTEERSNSTKVSQLDGKPKKQRGRKRTRDVNEKTAPMERDADVDNDDNGNDDDDEDIDRDEMGNGQGKNSGSQKAQVKCPQCSKKMCARGLKRHQMRCANKNRFVCPLCQHKSRESYDHTVHVDNHRIWVKAQSSWVDKSKGSTAVAADTATKASSASSVSVVDSTPPSIPLDSNSVMADGDKVDYPSTVDLDALAMITQIQGENEVLQQSQHLMNSGCSRDTERDLQPSELSDMASLPNGTDADNSRATNSPSVEQESKCMDGGEKKLNPRDLKCKICYTWFGRTSLPKHMLQVHNMVKRFQCRQATCKLIFAKLEDFKHHISSHSTDNMFCCGCRGCVNRRLITPETMDNIRKEKMRDYYKHMSHKCSKCWVKFPSQGSLDRHMKKESHCHPCSSCGKIQVSKRQLRMHMVTHQDERAYLCEVCGQNFKTKRDLNKHTFSHNNIRPFQCPQCSKCFSFRNKMTRHVVTVHSTKKPFNCDWQGCDKAFSRKDKLNDHAKTHLVSVPFRCQYCNKGFYRKDNLKDHEILHTRDFPFRCAECDRGFMRPKILERHRLTEHPSATTQVTLQANITQDSQTDSPGQSISYVLCEPYVYTSIDSLTSFQDSVHEADVQLMQGQHATIEAIQNAAAAVIGNGQGQFQIDGTDPFPVITLGT